MKSTLALLAILLAGCMNTKVQLDKQWNPSSKPSYVDYFDSYWWGFSGKPELSLQKVCMDQRPHGFQRVKTAEDIFISAVTLGIYYPTTVKVWCGR